MARPRKIDQGIVMNQKEAISKAPSGRVRRSPLARKQRLNVVGKEDGFEYRVVNDIDDRIQEFKDQGYELVEKNSVRVGDTRVESTSAEGSLKQLSVGQGIKAYVMRKRNDWYAEDTKVKQDYVDETERATKQQALDGTYGKLDFSRN